MMRHAGGARREDGEIAAALSLELELRLDRLPQHLVRDAEVCAGWPPHRVGKAGKLLVAELMQRLRLGRVVAVDVDDHLKLPQRTALRRDRCAASGAGRRRSRAASA